MKKIAKLSLIAAVAFASSLMANDIKTNSEIGIQSEKTFYNQPTLEKSASVYGKVEGEYKGLFSELEVGTIDSKDNLVQKTYGDFEIGYKNNVENFDYSLSYRHIFNAEPIVTSKGNDSIVAKAGYTLGHDYGLTRVGVRFDSIQDDDSYKTSDSELNLSLDRRAVNLTHHCDKTDLDLFAEYAQLGNDNTESYEFTVGKNITDTVKVKASYSEIDLDLDGDENILSFKLIKSF